MIDRKELELLVRAQIKGGKDLDSVAKSISDIGDAIKEQSDAAKRGESRIDELKSSLEALALIQKDLAGQASAVKYFQRLAEGVTKSEAAVEKATKRYDEYRTKLEAAGKSTEQQQNTLQRYATAVEKSNKALSNQRANLEAMEKEFRDAGMAVENLANVQHRNANVQAELGLVYQRGKEAVRTYAAEVRRAREEQAKLDKANADAAASAKLFEDAEKRAAAATRARAQAAAEVDAARANRSAEVAASRRLDDQQRQQAKRAQELAALQKDIVDRSTTSALNDQANAAIKTAQGYTTLARAATDLRPKVGGFRDAVRDILDPTRQATASIEGMEKQVADLAAGVTKIRGPIKGYREQVDSLLQAQRSIATQAGLIDHFNKQVVALRAARAAFVENRAEVTRYATEMQRGGVEGGQFAAKLAQAQNQLRGSAQALAQQVAVTRESREALRGAGIASNELAAAQGRLNVAARSSLDTLTKLGAGYEKYGAAVERTRKGQGMFADEGRTTLSYLQRLRGEVLSLVAAYGGLYTVINTARGAVDASSTREGVRNQLGLSVGNDRARIDEEYAYVKGQADRIGIEFERSIQGYAKFSAAATLAGRSRQEIRYIYETFAEVSRVANLSAEDLDGVFKALEQITSKGKIQAEELRGQLGDRLFGAFEIAAKALKDQFPDLDKALKNGEVTSKQLVLIAEQYRKTVADQLPAATKSLAAQQARLNNELFDFKLAVADSGFIEAYSEALSRLTDFLRSDDGKQFANNVGLGFKALADLFVLVLDNLDLIILGVKLFFTFFAYTRFASGLKGLTEMKDTFGSMRGIITGLGEDMGKLQKAFAALFVFVAAFQFGTYLYNEFQIVRTAGTNLVTSLLKAWAVIKASYQAAVEALPVFTRDVFAKIVSVIKSAARGLVGIFAGIAEAVGLDGLGAALRGVERNIDTAFAGFGKTEGVISSFRQNLAKELAEIERIRQEMLADDSGRNMGRAGARGTASPTGRPPNAGGGGKGGPSEAEIKKRQNEIEAITKALEALDSKIDRSQTETLQKQLDAIDSQYAALSRRIEKLGGETGKAFMARLTATIQELREVTIKKFNDDLAKDLNAFLKKTGDAEEQANKRATLDLQKRQQAIIGDYEQLYKELADLRLKFYANDRDTAPLDAARERLRISEAQRLDQETVKFNTEELNRKEQLLNDTIAARDKLLQAVNVQREVGQINDVEAAQKLNKIQSDYVPKINAAAEATKLWAEQNDRIFANQEQKDVFLATLEAIRLKAVGVKTEFSLLESTVVNGMVNGVSTGLNTVADSLTNMANGTQSVREGFMGMITGFAQFAAQFLRDIAIMIAKMAIFKAMQSSGNIYVQAAGNAGMASMGVRHSGGVIGGVSNRTRTMPTAMLANAPRYHSGGIPNLASNEYATILKKNEEVLTDDSPRNILNGGAAANGGGAGMMSLQATIVDSRDSVPAAMATPAGRNVILETMRTDVSTVKSILGIS